MKGSYTLLPLFLSSVLLMEDLSLAHCFVYFSMGLRYQGTLRFCAVWLNGEQN